MESKLVSLCHRDRGSPYCWSTFLMLSRMDAKEGGTEGCMLPSDRAALAEQRPHTRLPQYLVTLAVSLTAFSTGNILGWTAPALPFLEGCDSPLPVTKHESSWIGSLVAVGACIGALPVGPLTEIFGRRLVILCSAGPLLISWMLIFCATSVYFLYIARLIAGVGVGAVCTTVPTYISEIAEPRIRGTLCLSFQMMLVCGILFSYALGAILHYPVLLILNGVVPFIFLAAFFKAPESPVHSLKKGQRQQAENALRVLRGRHYNVFKELHALENEMNENKEEKSSLGRLLLKRASRVSLTICLGLMAFQQLSGINVIIFYTADLFKSAGSTMSPALATILVGIAQVIATIVSGVLIDTSGRKVLLQTSASVMSVCLLVLGWYFHLQQKGTDTSAITFLPLLSLVLYIIVFAVGFGPIPWMMCGEILPNEIKGIGTGIAVAFNWFLAFTVTKTYQLLVEYMGSAKTFWMFGVISFAGFLFSTFVVIETKKKSLTEIQSELSGHKPDQRRSNVI
ncbi:trehalose transporter 1-like protein isoform X2 [Rhodnius prolixus]|uniref:trehalose transporter 1-like protein isoform X2 n=1 Tax=Rhodnius prolixus TaxID=13249 RepID=UPI003D1899A6